MGAQKCQHAIEVSGDGFIRAQRLELARDALKYRHSDDRRTRNTCSLPAPRRVEPLEDIKSAEEAGFAQRTIERRDFPRAKRSTVAGLELKMWRTKQGDSGNPREIRADAREQHVDNSRVRFSRQRKRIEHLMRDTRSTKHFTGEVHVRQPLAYNECGAVENVTSSGNFIANPSSEFSNLLFSIASQDGGGRGQEAGGSRQQVRGLMLRADFLDSRQPLMNPFMKAASKRRIGHDDVYALQFGEAGKKVPVNRIQAIPIRGAIAHGDDDVPPRLIGFCVEQPLPDGMLVDTSGVCARPFEFAE